ncbi:three-deoxy-D-manno-octulosonic-acid transferase [Parvularcula bermudensis HTCC2503]|uniref:3-deoxy-D-manno-octulosonic acid transferase n=1 Tax=Parvularcula bermudensis (strain ATCC BAA-594 / HTCC2503 / KCTC 12087) TaxID=314260 RepID=E0TGQ8_PARBH|nr:3-deoxy-D-manno-octulosonic acid transferase [Parvularcula bermudensis]ADM10667.1 three-deoxy-D-manno-octulosonic-acid transferase [Parvularcula bermudensis HTCC2503]
MTAAPVSLSAYRALTHCLRPLAELILWRRVRAGKEEAERLDERRGRASLPRPAGPVMWIHGASVGESLSALPLIARLREERPDLFCLVTTGTVTSARLLAERLPEGSCHQYIPIDHPVYVHRFLDHWRPDGGLFIEAELWPVLLSACQRRDIPLALLNGRLSPSAFEGWSKRPRVAAALYGAFSVLTAQDQDNAARLTTLARRPVESPGNLKQAAPPPPAEPAAISALKAAIGDRPVILAASTHAGEEELILRVHQELRGDYPSLLTLIVPRHPERGADIDAMIAAKGLSGGRRSVTPWPRPSDAVFIADTLGELGLFYRLTVPTFMGGSLVDRGGHNPIEPAHLSVPLFVGPHLFNFAETYAALEQVQAVIQVSDVKTLATAMAAALRAPAEANAMGGRARSWAERGGADVMDRTIDYLAPLLPAKPHQPTKGGTP